MAATNLPSVNLEAFDHLLFVLDEDDVAYLHMDGPRAAITEQVDDGWYIRIADEAIVGLEIHGFKRVLLSTPFYSRTCRPALDEIEKFTGRSFDSDSIHAAGTIDELPKTTHLVMFMMGLALSKFSALRHAEFEDAGRQLLAV